MMRNYGRLSQAIIFTTSLVLLLLGCQSSEPPPIEETFVLDGDLPIAVAETAVVGTTVEVLVGPVDVPNDVPILLTYSNSYGIHLLRATFQEQYAWFELKPEMTIRAGMATLVVTSGHAYGEAMIDMQADRMVDPVVPLVGARSIIADGAHYAMAVVVPTDQYGNPPPNGTMVDYKSLHPGDNLRQYEDDVEHLLSWIRVYSGTTAGRTIITAVVDDAFGPEGTLTEIPGWPEPFNITATPPTLPADGFHLVNLRSDTIVDRFGNVISDGTIVEYQLIGPDGAIREFPTLVIDGIAEVEIQSPRTPGMYEVRGLAYGMQTEPIEIEFSPGPALGQFEVLVRVDMEAGDLVVTAGPLISPLDQFVADGTDVFYTFTDENDNKWTEVAYAEAGYAELSVRLVKLEETNYQIDVRVGTARGSAEFFNQVQE